MGLLRVKATAKRAGKGFLKLLFGKGRVHFFGIEVLRKCAKSSAEKKSRKGINYAN
jgi:hypothetical protein